MTVQTPLGTQTKQAPDTKMKPVDVHAENGFYGAPRRDIKTAPQGEIRVVRFVELTKN